MLRDRVGFLNPQPQPQLTGYSRGIDFWVAVKELKLSYHIGFL